MNSNENDTITDKEYDSEATKESSLSQSSSDHTEARNDDTKSTKINISAFCKKIIALTQKEIQSFPLKLSLKFQAIGLVLTLLWFIALLSYLHYNAPQLLNTKNTPVWSSVIDVPAKPKPVTISKNTLSTTKDKASAADSPKNGDDHIDQNNASEKTKHTAHTPSDHGNEAPYNFYKVKDTPEIAASKAKIAIIIIDAGLNRKKLRSIYEQSPSMTTFAFSPYSDFQNLSPAPSNKKFENWITLPTERTNQVFDPGIMGLYNSRDLTLNNNALTRILEKNDNFTGFFIPPYSALPQAKDQYKSIITRLYDLGFGIADSSFSPINPSIMTLGKGRFPYFQVDVFINETFSPNEIEANFKKLEVIAEENNKAIGILKPSPSSISYFEKWSKTLTKRGFVLVPISALF